MTSDQRFGGLQNSKISKGFDMVVVIGAGLAGLSAALTLQKAGREVRVVEASDRPGGRLTTDYVDDYRLDRGFQLINSGYPELKRLNIINELHFQYAPRAVKVVLGKKSVELGDPRRYVVSAFNSQTGSIAEKLAFVRYLASKPRVGESVESHLIRVGTGTLYKRVLRKFLQGVFLSDPSQVSATVGKEIVRSFISGEPGLPAAGVAKLSEVLSHRIHQIEFNHRVDSLEEFAKEDVIVATDATNAAHLLGLSSIPTQLGSTTWYHSTSEPVSDSSMLHIDGEDRGAVVNSIVISNLSSAYSPEGKSLISTTTLIPTSESEVRRHLSIIWGAPTGDWELVAKYDIPASLPLFGTDSQRVTSARVTKGVYVAGDYRCAPSQNGALLSGRLTAQELL